MNKQRFTKVLRDPGKLKDEFVELQELQLAYPYAQSIHVLLAILNKNQNSNKAGDALNYAALYVADRHNLRDIMEKGFQDLPKSSSPLKVEKEEKKVETKKGLKKIEESTIKTAPEVSTSKNKESKDPTSEDKSEVQEIVVEKSQGPVKPNVDHLPSEGDKMRSDLIKNLQILQASKREWDSDEFVKEKKHTADPKANDENLAQTQEQEPPEKSKTKRTDKQKPKLKTKKAEKLTNKPKKTESPEKIKKQQELISKFIEISPSIKAKANNPPIISSEQEDLSVSSTSFSDGLISENLADIFIKQGKLDKAIDIYKKLIWKFPQKKGYFAARIEELSKKKG